MFSLIYVQIMFTVLTAVYPSLLSAKVGHKFTCQDTIDKGADITEDGTMDKLLPLGLSQQELMNSCRLLNSNEVDDLVLLLNELDIKSELPSEGDDDFKVHFGQTELIDLENRILNKTGLHLSEMPFSNEDGVLLSQSEDLLIGLLMDNLLIHYLYYKLILEEKIFESEEIQRDKLYPNPTPIRMGLELKLNMNKKIVELREAILYLKTKYPVYFDNKMKDILLFSKITYDSSKLKVEPFDIKHPVILEMNSLGIDSVGSPLFYYSGNFRVNFFTEDCNEPYRWNGFSEFDIQNFKDVLEYLKQDGIYSLDPKQLCENKNKPIPEEKLNCYQTGVNLVLSKNSNSFVRGNHSISTDGYGTCQFITALWNTKGSRQNSYIDFIFGRFYNQAKQTENIRCDVITNVKTNPDGSLDKNLQVSDCQNLTDAELLELSKRSLRAN